MIIKIHIIIIIIIYQGHTKKVAPIRFRGQILTMTC